MRRLILAMAVAALASPALAVDENDQKVANQIAANLKSNSDLRGYEVAVKYRDGTARLEGWVRNPQQMELALSVAQRTPQVKQVINKLTVKQEERAAQPATHNEPGPLLRRTSQLRPAPLAAPTTRQTTAPAAVPAPPTPIPATPAPIPAAPAPIPAAPAPIPAAPTPVAAAPQPQAFVPAPRGAMPIAVRRQPMGAPVPEYVPGTGGGVAPALYDQAHLPAYAWPTYTAYPNYGGLTYPKQYSPTAWPYIGPFYPYPQVPLGWRKVTLEWDDGWWFLDFSDDRRHCCGR